MTSEVTEWNLFLEVLRSQKEGCQRPNVAHGPLFWIDLGGDVCVLAPVLGPHGLGSLPGRRKDTAVFSWTETKKSNIIFSTNLKKKKQKNSANELLTLTP